MRCLQMAFVSGTVGIDFGDGNLVWCILFGYGVEGEYTRCRMEASISSFR